MGRKSQGQKRNKRKASKSSAGKKNRVRASETLRKDRSSSRSSSAATSAGQMSTGVVPSVPGGGQNTIQKSAIFHIMLESDGAPPECNKGKMKCYAILNDKHQRLFTAKEDRPGKGGNRPFHLTLHDDQKRAMMTVERKGNSMLSCFGAKCCGNDARVTKDNSLLGTIQQKYAHGLLKFAIFDSYKSNVISVVGPSKRVCCSSHVGDEVTFRIHNVALTAVNDHNQIGAMRVYSAPEAFTNDPYIFSVEVPKSLSPDLKLLVLAAGVVVDLSYYENNPGLTLQGNFFCAFVFLLIIIVFVGVFCLIPTIEKLVT